MAGNQRESDRRGVLIISALAGFIVGLCGVTPVVLLLLGLASISVAADLGNVLYGDYRWLFRLATLAFLSLAMEIYLRRRGICILGQARGQRNRVVNTSLIVFIAGVGIHNIWNYIPLGPTCI